MSRMLILSAALAAMSFASLVVVADQKQTKLDNLLFAAVDNGDSKAVRTLLTRGASPNAAAMSKLGLKNSRHHEPKPGEYTGEDVGEPTYKKVHMPALIRAIWNGDRAIVELLVAKGANVNARNGDGSTALMWAIQHGDKKVINLLLSKKADVNAKDSHGMTALDLAMHKNDRQLYEKLRKAGAR